MILINPPSLASLNKAPGKRSKLYKFLLEIPVFGTLVYNMKTSQSNVQLLFTEKYLYNPFHTTPELIDTYYETAHKDLGSAKYLLSSLCGLYTNNSITHALKCINQSIVILTGETEPEGEEIASAYIELNPAIETCKMKRAKHLPHLETPQEFTETLKIYL